MNRSDMALVGPAFMATFYPWALRWGVAEFSADSTAIVRKWHAVVDDFGDLVDDRNEGRQYYARSDSEPWSDDEHAAWDRWLHAGRRPPAPQPVTVEIASADEDYWPRPLTEIRVSHDDRRDLSACYRLDVAGNDEILYLSHAQLAALLVAAEQLCKPVRTRTPRRERAAA